ncbi:MULTISPECIES: C-terminal binding protein [Marinovum]|uniref:D-3-phosphoglycerate dehydrogenase n=1 Tax=Marinovum algicola TaxID=42444 RepID=A0A975WFL9_9RHOB|nr:MULTISPECIES: C-terminal binding protein [Marinovum]MDD9739193.1 C-terminal binding protein [Marinovum sp. SP66]SEK11841.1 D-3-phosphoglycerate dehydrogenase [Marinovum algicola]SLN77563.1 D-3-phosphoglycerate dehydrogenase [Marinovum algicola]
MNSKPKVVITDYDFGDVDIERGILEAAGANVVALQAKQEADLFEEARDCAAIMNQYARVGAETIARMERCKVIARYGVGVDIVDVDAATDRGILVTNVRDYCTEEVADHAIALWMALARSLPAYDRATHAGVWRWQSGAPVRRLRGRTMGIVSFGKIGQAIARRARAFGTEIIAYDPFLPADVARELGVELVTKDALLARSDYILMQAPMTKETHHFLSDAEFAVMKPGAILVNTGRGPTVDNKALYRALTEGHLAAAGLDDPEEEPAKRATWDPADNPIFTLPNVLITPHAAYYSEESIRAAREGAATQVAKVLTGQTPDFPVNADALAVQS